MKKWVIHAIAVCGDCDWREEDYKTAHRKAADHHRKTGHFVAGEVGTHFEYGERNKTN